jgi:hypothetical protein
VGGHLFSATGHSFRSNPDLAGTRAMYPIAADYLIVSLVLFMRSPWRILRDHKTLALRYEIGASFKSRWRVLRRKEPMIRAVA